MYGKDFSWTTGDDSKLLHARLIDIGSCGDVHEASTSYLQANWSQLKNVVAGEVFCFGSQRSSDDRHLLANLSDLAKICHHQWKTKYERSSNYANPAHMKIL